MPIIDFLMLFVAAISAVFAGLAYTMISRDTPKLTAAKILVWLAAIGFGSLGIMWGATNSNYPVLFAVSTYGSDLRLYLKEYLVFVAAIEDWI